MKRINLQTISTLWAACVLAGCASEAPVAEKIPRPVRIIVAQPPAQSPRVRYSANVVPREQVSVAFKTGGYIREVLQVRGLDGRSRNLQEGDTVAQGAVLARVIETDYAERRNQAQASLREVQAALQKASLDHERARKLFDNQSLTKPEYDSAVTSLEVSQARVEAAQASVEQTETALKDTALIAPLDGVVLRRSIEVGSLVGAGTVAFVLADTSAVKAVFGVPDVMMRRARLGLSLPVRTESYGTREFPGRITAISPAADPASRVFDVELTIPNQGDLLKPGMIATVEVPERAEEAPEQTFPVVPLRAIVKTLESEEGFSLFVLEEQSGKQIARIRPVQVGQVYGNQIALTNGVKMGENVVVSGAAQLVDGEEVRVIP